MAYIEIGKAIAEIDKGDLLVGNNAEWAKEIIRRTPTADVAPKSEVEELKARLEINEKAYEALRNLYNADTKALVETRRKTEAEVAREIFKEIEKVRIISRACEKRGITYDFSEFYAELKKKYTEVESGTQ